MAGQEILTNAWSRNLDKNPFIAKKACVKQGLPVRKKALLTAVFISVLLFSAVAGTDVVNVGKANPFSQAMYSGEMTPPSSTTPPSITISSPVNNQTYDDNSVVLSLDAVVGQASYSRPSYVFHGLSLTDVYFEADWLENKTVVNGTSKFSFVYEPVISKNSTDNLHPSTEGSYSCYLRLEDIPEGNHSITVKATERGYYFYVVGGVSFEYYGYSKTATSSVNFTIDTVPIVSFLSFENTALNVSEVPLNFTVNQAFSNATYSLDGQQNVAISGNTTLTGLPNGDHNITVFATDEGGNVGASETIYFEVDVPEPFPTALAAAASVATAVVVGGGLLLVYFKKRQRGKSP
jgi:hypothetical protein